MRFVLSLVMAVLVAVGASAQDGPQITVVGEGQVAVVPDMATIRLGVTAEAETAREAMDQTSDRVTALLAGLAEAGIEARDIQTSGLSLNPRWDYRSSGPSGENRIISFVASNAVSVRVRELDRLGGVLDRVLEAGANTFSGLQFGLQDPEPTLDVARAAAVADARRKAELYAQAADVTLGPIISISEPQISRVPQPMFRMEQAMASDQVPVAPGELDMSAQVVIVWALGG